MLRSLLLASAVAAVSSTAVAQTVTVPVVEGGVTLATVDPFSTAIDNQMDRVIGLKVRIEPHTEAERQAGYYADADEGYLNVGFSAGLGEGGYEIIIRDGFRWEHGGWVIDGFYLVKSGGMHQGTISYGLEAVDEATVRLNPALRFTTVELR